METIAMDAIAKDAQFAETAGDYHIHDVPRRRGSLGSLRGTGYHGPYHVLSDPNTSTYSHPNSYHLSRDLSWDLTDPNVLVVSYRPARYQGRVVPTDESAASSEGYEPSPHKITVIDSHKERNPNHDDGGGFAFTGDSNRAAMPTETPKARPKITVEVAKGGGSRLKFSKHRHSSANLNVKSSAKAAASQSTTKSKPTQASTKTEQSKHIKAPSEVKDAYKSPPNENPLPRPRGYAHMGRPYYSTSETINEQLVKSTATPQPNSASSSAVSLPIRGPPPHSEIHGRTMPAYSPEPEFAPERLAYARMLAPSGLADLGPTQQTWVDQNGERFHFRALAAVMQSVDSQKIDYMPITDSRMVPISANMHNVAAMHTPVQTHTVQEWDPPPRPSKEEIRKWKGLHILFRGYDGRLIGVRNGCKDSGSDFNTISPRLLQVLGLQSEIIPPQQGDCAETHGGLAYSKGSVWLPFIEDPDGKRKPHPLTCFQVMDSDTYDVVLGDEWCMVNQALNAEEIAVRPQSHVMQWVKKETPEEARTSQSNDQWQQREAVLAQQEAAQRRLMRMRSLQQYRSAPQPQRYHSDPQAFSGYTPTALQIHQEAQQQMRQLQQPGYPASSYVMIAAGSQHQAPPPALIQSPPDPVGGYSIGQAQDSEQERQDGWDRRRVLDEAATAQAFRRSSYTSREDLQEQRRTPAPTPNGRGS